MVNNGVKIALFCLSILLFPKIAKCGTYWDVNSTSGTARVPFTFTNTVTANTLNVTGSMSSSNFYPGVDKNFGMSSSGGSLSMQSAFFVGTDSRTAVDLRPATQFWGASGAITERVIYSSGTGNPGTNYGRLNVGYQSYLNQTFSMEEECDGGYVCNNISIGIGDHTNGNNRNSIEVSGAAGDDLNASLGSVLFGGFAQKSAELVTDTAPVNMIILRTPFPTSNVYNNSQAQIFSGLSYNTANHRSDWKEQVVLSSQNATSAFVFSSRIDAAGFTTRAFIADTGAFGVNASTMTSGVIKFEVVGSSLSNPAIAGSTQNGIMRMSNNLNNAALDFGTNGSTSWIQANDKANLALPYSLNLQPSTGTGVQIGSPTGGDKGTGSLNVSGDIYKNNTAYINPDYAIEFWSTGRIDRFRFNPGASSYRGRMNLNVLESYMRKNFSLPGVHKASGAFERTDILLEKVEEAYIYIIEQNKRIESLEIRLNNLERNK